MADRPYLAAEVASLLRMHTATVVRNHERYGGYRQPGERPWKFPRRLIDRMAAGYTPEHGSEAAQR